MSTFFKNIFENNDNTPIHKIIFSLLGIVFIRVFLENFSSPDLSGFFFSWKDSYLQFPIYYASVFLSFSLLLYFFTRKPLNQILNFEIKIFMFALLPPIVDLLATGGKGSAISYVFTEPQNFLSVFLKLINPFGFDGVTFGVHVAAYAILISIGIFTYKATKNVLKSLLIIFVSYVVLFLYALTPSIIALPHFFHSDANSIAYSYGATLSDSWIIITQKTASEPLSFLNVLNINASKNEPITQLFFLYLTLQLILSFAIFKPDFWASIRNNLRWERMCYWSFIAAIGIVMNQKIFGELHLLNMVNAISLLIFFLLIALNAWLAICVNDPEDIAIDTISNPERPLIQKVVLMSEWQTFQFVLLLLVLLGSATMNHTLTFLLILSQLIYYIYSAQPLRLKQHFLSSSILIGIASVAVAMAGFFLVSPDQHIKAFPIQAILIIGISYALLSNLKDIKDFEGDSHENIRTMPVVFGLKNAKYIIATLCATVIVTVPLILKIYSILFLSICIALFLFYLFTKKKYQEKYIFLVFFLYMLALFFAAQ